MKLGFGTLRFGEGWPSSTASFFRTLRSFGFDGVEIAQSPEALQVSASTLARHARKSGIELTGVLFGSLKSRQAYFQDFPGTYFYVSDWTSDCLAPLQQGITLALHPSAYLRMGNISRVDELLEEHENLRLIIDTGHLAVLDIDPRELIERWFDRVVAVHLKDWSRRFGRSLHTYMDGFCKLGDGDALLTETVQALNDRNYTGWTIIEDEGAYTNELVAIESGAAWAKRVGIPGGKRQFRPRSLRLDNAFLQSEATDAIATACRRMTAAAEFSPGGADSDPVIFAVAKIIGDALRAECTTIWAVSERNDSAACICIQGSSKDARDPLLLSKRFQQVLFDRAHQFNCPVPSDSSRFSHVLPVFCRGPSTPLRLVIECQTVGKRELESAAIWQLGSVISWCFETSTNTRLATARRRVQRLTDGNPRLGALLVDLCFTLRTSLPCEGVSLFAADMKSQQLRSVATTGLKWNEEPEHYVFGQGVTGDVWESGVSRIFPEPGAHERYIGKSHETVEHDDIDVCMWVPVTASVADSTVSFVIRARNKKSSSGIASFTEEDVSLAETLAVTYLPMIHAAEDEADEIQALSFLTHEIRAPLSSIRGQAGRLGRVLSQDAPRSAAMAVSDRATIALSMLRDFDFFRHWPQEEWPDCEIVDLRRDILEPAMSEVRALHRSLRSDIRDFQRKFRLKCFVNTGIPVFGIPAYLIQASYNLLANSLLHCGHKEVTVSIRATRQGGQTTLFVQDDGIGFTPGTDEVVFFPGVRGSRRDETPLLARQGLGLWAARVVAEIHGGRCWVQDTRTVALSIAGE